MTKKEETIERIKEIPDGFSVFIGPDNVFDKDELIDLVRKDNDMGKIIMEVDSYYHDFIKNGK